MTDKKQQKQYHNQKAGQDCSCKQTSKPALPLKTDKIAEEMNRMFDYFHKKNHPTKQDELEKEKPKTWVCVNSYKCPLIGNARQEGIEIGKAKAYKDCLDESYLWKMSPEQWLKINNWLKQRIEEVSKETK